jgi:WD40 repeat protein
VTNLVESPEGVLFATTTDSNVYTITNLDAFSPKLVMSSHYTKINDICFPSNCSDLFATASDSDVRIWNLNSHQELLRISVPNVKCNSVIFRKDGSSLITGTILISY